MSAKHFVRSAALIVTFALAASFVQVPPKAAAAGGPSFPLPQVPSVSVTSPGHTAPPDGDETSPGLSGDQEPRAIDPGSGDYTATSLRPSAAWEVAANTGDFSWTYPLRVPPAPGGLEPRLALSYSSGSVDGLTTSTNNQASWIGEGWSMWPGYIEREYRSCRDDLTTGAADDRPADLCWRNENATLSLNGTTPLILHDAPGGGWRPKNDDGSRIEPITTTGNGDDNGESWKVTTVDGTQYFFGSVPSAESTWTAPVFGDDAGEPCNAPGSFANSSCTQAWRWNLDKIVDRNGNMVLFIYKKEQNHYGRNKNTAAVPYDRGGWLHQIRYGLLADDGSMPASGVVDFETDDRCVPGSDCTWSKPDNLPDVPLNLKCDSGSCPDLWSPTFWTTKQLRTVTTRVLRDGDYKPVDSWTLRHEMPDPGDGEKPALWLKGITHTGHAGEPVTLPEVTFDGSRHRNRVQADDGYASLIRFRMNAIVSETGGVTSIRYKEPECVSGQTVPANAESNTLRCFPVRWKPKGSPVRTDYFHKYVVDSVSEMDGVAGTTAHFTSYEYLDGAGWHWPSTDSGEEDEKTWNEYRGFARVRIRVGNGNDGPRTMTEQRFFRGMYGDPQRIGTRTTKVKDSEEVEHDDFDWLRGFPLETATFHHEQASPSEPPRLTKTITLPFVLGPTASRGAQQAYVVRTGIATDYTLLTTGRRVTRSATEYDGYGLPTKVIDEGDLDKPDDNRCSLTTYDHDTTNWLLDFPSRSETFGVLCHETPQFPADAIADQTVTYDDSGNPTLIRDAGVRPASGPVYVTTATTKYDAHGRVTEYTDPTGNTTKTAYTPAAGGPTTKTVTTAPPARPGVDGLVTMTTFEPSFGQPVKVEDPNGRVSETAYDALGRKAEIWLPNRPRGTYATGNVRFAYTVRNNGPVAVTTTRIGPNGRFTDSTELYDGLLRPRQKQVGAAGGGRLLTDTRYDSHGRSVKTTKPYFNDAAVDTGLVFPVDADVPAISVTEYDGAGRPIAEVFKGEGFEWRTTTDYDGDRVRVTPRRGGTPTTTVVDAHGKTTELRQNHGRGEYATMYEYTKAGQLAKIVDPGGNIWSAEYDLRGRMTKLDDPDQGVSTMTYDDAGRITSRTDARGVTVAYSYDGRGRKIGAYKDRVGGQEFAAWTYDSASNGKGYLATSSRWVDGREYKTSIDNYSQLYQPTEKSVTIPAADSALTSLAGTYTWFGSYGWDGSLSGESHPAVGGLDEETVDYELDDLGLPKSSTGSYKGDTVDLVSAVNYTRYGEVERLQLGSGTKRAWISRYYEESTRRLARAVVDAEVPAPMQTDVNYTYDPQGNVTSITDSPLNRTKDVQCFRYDGLRQLAEAWTPSTDCESSVLGGPAPYRSSYTYDEVGNRVTETRGNITSTYAVPEAHMVSSVSTGTSTVDYTYDLAGNTLTRTGESFVWDAEGNLESVTKAGQKTSFVYSADGERLLKRDPGGITLYLADQEVRLASGSNNPTATRYYTLGKDTVAVRQGGTLTWLAADHQGTPEVAVNATTQQVSRRRQDPFGVPRGPVPSSWPGEKSFVGGEQDTSTGLTHLGARDYDPKLGRFMSLDPVLDQADPQQMHGYGYGNNSPVNFEDATGLFISECDECGYVDSHAFASNPESYTPRGNGGGGSKLPSWFEPTKKVNDILGGVFDGSFNLNDLAKEAAKALREGQSIGSIYQNMMKQFPVLQKLNKLANSPLFRMLGKASMVLGGGLSFTAYLDQGDSVGTAMIKTGIETAFSLGGAAVGGAWGGSIGWGIGSVPGSAFGGLLGAGFGAVVGNSFGGVVAKTVDPVVAPIGDSLTNGGSEAMKDIPKMYSVVEDLGVKAVSGDGLGAGDLTNGAEDIVFSVLGW